MNYKKLITILKKATNKYLKAIVYSFFFLILIISIFFTYVNVYKTVLAPNEIEDSEIIAKKQKVNITLFKLIEEKINSKKDTSVEKIPNVFN